MLSHAMPMLSPDLACRKIRILNPCCSPSPPPRITSEKRRIFGGVSTLKWAQNGSVLEENGTLFDKFWIDLGKMRTFDRLSRNFARSFMLDSWHTRLLARNDRLIKKQRTRKALERSILLGGIAPLRAQDVIAMERHGSDEGISAHRLVGNLHRSGIGNSHRSLTRVEATLILLQS